MTTRKQQLQRRRKRRNEDRAKRNQQARKATAHETPRQYVRQQRELEFLRDRGARSGKEKGWKGGISPIQFWAGDMLYRTWRVSGWEPCIVPQYSRIPGLPARQEMERQLDAQQATVDALRSRSRLHRAVLIHVCLHDDKLAQWQLPPSRGLEVLREALDRLADWYEGERRHGYEARELEVA